MSIVKVGSIINPTTGDTTVTDNLSRQVCTAWVNFDGTSGAIRDSFNVSSVTVDAAGRYTITFAIPMLTTNYSANTRGTTADVAASSWGYRRTQATHNLASYSYVDAADSAGVPKSMPICSVQIFGGK